MAGTQCLLVKSRKSLATSFFHLTYIPEETLEVTRPGLDYECICPSGCTYDLYTCKELRHFSLTLLPSEIWTFQCTRDSIERQLWGMRILCFREGTIFFVSFFWSGITVVVMSTWWFLSSFVNILFGKLVSDPPAPYLAGLSYFHHYRVVLVVLRITPQYDSLWKEYRRFLNALTNDMCTCHYLLWVSHFALFGRLLWYQKFHVYEFSQPTESYVETCTSFYMFSGLRLLTGWVGYWTPTQPHHRSSASHVGVANVQCHVHMRGSEQEEGDAPRTSGSPHPHLLCPRK